MIGGVEAEAGRLQQHGVVFDPLQDHIIHQHLVRLLWAEINLERSRITLKPALVVVDAQVVVDLDALSFNTALVTSWSCLAYSGLLRGLCLALPFVVTEEVIGRQLGGHGLLGGLAESFGRAGRQETRVLNICRGHCRLNPARKLLLGRFELPFGGLLFQLLLLLGQGQVLRRHRLAQIFASELLLHIAFFGLGQALDELEVLSDKVLDSRFEQSHVFLQNRLFGAWPVLHIEKVPEVLGKLLVFFLQLGDAVCEIGRLALDVVSDLRNGHEVVQLLGLLRAELANVGEPFLEAFGFLVLLGAQLFELGHLAAQF